MYYHRHGAVSVYADHFIYYTSLFLLLLLSFNSQCSKSFFTFYLDGVTKLLFFATLVCAKFYWSKMEWKKEIRNANRNAILFILNGFLLLLLLSGNNITWTKQQENKFQLSLISECWLHYSSLILYLYMYKYWNWSS